LHLARASGEDHASTGVPPQSVSTRPIGYPRYSYMSRPNSQHTAEKYFQAPPFTLSMGTVLQHGWRVRTRIYLYLILYEALEDARAQVCYNSIMQAIILPQSMLYHQFCCTEYALCIPSILLHNKPVPLTPNIAPMCCLEAHGCNTLHSNYAKVLLTHCNDIYNICRPHIQ